MQEIEAIVPYRNNFLKQILFYSLCVVSFGLVYVVATWHYKFWAILRVSKCDIFAAQYFRILAKDGTQTIVECEHYQIGGLDFIVSSYSIQGFTYRYYRFMNRQGRFEKIELLVQSNSEVHRRDHVQSQQQLIDYQNLYGSNSTEIPRQPIMLVLIDELMHPLFVVQLLQIMLWIYEQYTSYAIILLIVSIVSMIDTLVEFKQSYREIRNNSKFEHEVKVIRFNQQQVIHSREVVPGDILIIEPYQVIPCDCVLIQGTCIVQEQYLNGEQTPITKIAVQDDKQNFKQHPSQMLYMSTQCLRADDNCLAFVIATGFNTKKGELIREIMLTPDYSFNFYQDSMRYLKYLSLVAIVGYLIALPFKIYFIISYPFIEPTDLITDILDLLAVCVPPTLPTTLQIGLSLALKRFKRKRIYCFNPHKINLAGVVNYVCFDKTGTLTEEEQRLYGAIIMNKEGTFDQLLQELGGLNRVIRLVMACCNNIVNEEEIIYGDNLDLALFKNSKAKINYRNVELDSAQYEIVKTFEFSQELQRIGCIVYGQGEKLFLIKGSPEKIKDMCIHIPEDYTQIYKYYAHHGFKVIACAYKQLEQDQVIPSREQCEQNLIFLGLLALENRVRKNAETVIKQLRQAKVETLLVTGDNVLTSIRVAKMSKIVDETEQLVYGDLLDNEAIDWKDIDVQYQEIEEHMHHRTKTICIDEISQKLPQPTSKINIDAKSVLALDQCSEEASDQLQKQATLAITGRLFIHLLQQAKSSKDYKYIDQLISKTRVYAKMKREHKAELIRYLKTTRQIAFCGDGGADIQAMRTADVGISLTNTKLSLAAPFTSGQEDLSTVPIILIEGRGALTTSFQSFEYMTMCSLVQFFSCTILYFKYSYMTNSQFLVVDLFVVLPLSILMSYTDNLKHLTREIPQRSLLSAEVLSIILGQCFIQMTFQFFIYIILINQEWYRDPVTLSRSEYGESGFMQSFEATSLFLATNLQYIMLSVSLSYDPRFKKPFYTNMAFTIYFVMLLIFELYLLMFTYENDTEDDYFNVKYVIIVAHIQSGRLLNASILAIILTGYPIAQLQCNSHLLDVWSTTHHTIIEIQIFMKILYTFTRIVRYQGKAHQILTPSLLPVPKDAFIAKCIFSDGTTQLHDLNRPLNQDCNIEFLDFSNSDAKRVFWHSSAHVLGAVLSKMGAQLEFGPSTENGFYYQCKLKEEIELDYLNQEIEKFLKLKGNFEIQSLTYEEAVQQFQNNPYKLNKIQQQRLESYQVYKLNNFIDLCRGPHIDNIQRIHRLIVNHSQPYGDSFRYQGVAFPDSKTYQVYQHQQECDHRHIGKSQNLFVFNKLAPGSAFFLPHGTKIYNKLIAMIRKEYHERGFQEVITPQLFHKDLWKQSGHLDKYAENIYMTHDGQMGLKPMNCPGHCLLYKTLQHSYKELPIRYADFGVLHRNEVHGTLTGLTRVRKFTQDDAHIFCRVEQIQQEIRSSLDFLAKVYGRFGFTWELTLSTRPEKYIGDLKIWEEAERQLRIALSDTPYTENVGDGAFYGPKIDVLIRDHNGKQHQCGTIQLDFNLPERFDLIYHQEDDHFSRPVMIHRAILGSVERMMAILTEQYNGKWPFWLSPRQLLVIPVNDASKEYAKKVYEQLQNFDVEMEDTDATLGKRIRKGELLHFNYILTIGAKECEQQTVNVRERGLKSHTEMKLDEFITKIIQL